MGRGRRDPENCALTDVINGWTVMRTNLIDACGSGPI